MQGLTRFINFTENIFHAAHCSAGSPLPWEPEDPITGGVKSLKGKCYKVQWCYVWLRSAWKFPSAEARAVWIGR